MSESQLQRSFVLEQIVVCCHDHLVHHGNCKVEQRPDDALTTSREKYVLRHAQRYDEQFRWSDTSVRFLAASCLSLKKDGVSSRSARRPQNSSMEERSSSVDRKPG